MLKNKKPLCDPMNERFARVMENLTWIGLAAMVIFGLFFLFNVHTYLSAQATIADWQFPVAKFWQAEKGVQINGYLWLLSSMNDTDSLSVLGICILALTPFFSVVATIPRCPKGIHSYFLVILALELIFCMAKPIIIPSIGG